MNWLGLDDRAAAVTGASGGIGRATAVALATAGCLVALLDRAAEALDETRSEIAAVGGQAVAIPCDVSVPGSIEAAAAQSLVAHGPCDVLVRNAGVLRPGPLETLELAEWNALLAINLTGNLPCAQSFGRQMHGRGGALVHAAVIPSARIGQPQDIADAVLFLASPRSAYVNGDEIVVDGAFTRGIMGLIPRAGYEAPDAPRRD